MAVDEDVARVERERDEAREALRDVLDAGLALDEAEGNGVSGAPLADAQTRLGEAVQRGCAVLEGVKRTHALVPVEFIDPLAELAALSSRPKLAIALRVAARGEHPVEWPS